MSFNSVLPVLAEKWREVPGGSDLGERSYTDDMASLSDAALLAEWDRQNTQGAELRGWWWSLYATQFRGRKVLEIGSGMGFDALHFASSGAQWTCCDIAPSNLKIIERVAAAKGATIRTLPIESLASFDTLPRDFDFVWCNGSLLHIPFESAREECAAILGHLKPGGRWIELAYPRERWIREGSPAFDKWGALTDGERTPWVEWYDVEKLKQRLYPARLRTVLDYKFHSDYYIWMDLEVASRDASPGEPGAASSTAPGPAPGRVASPLGRLIRSLCRVVGVPSRPEIPSGLLFAAPGLWRDAWSMPLLRGSHPPAVTVDVECAIEAGAISFTLAKDGRAVSREIVAEARIGSQLLHLVTPAFEEGVRLVARNGSALGGGRFQVMAVTIRPTL